MLNRLFREGGPGTRIYLAPCLVINVQDECIELSHDYQEIATLGYPYSNEKKATIKTSGSTSRAINGVGRNHIRIRNLILDGQEHLGRTEFAEPLCSVGGPNTFGSIVERCVLTRTRGWTCCHVVDWCSDVRIVDNEVGPAGWEAPEGPWADGLSLACQNGIIVSPFW